MLPVGNFAILKKRERTLSPVHPNPRERRQHREEVCVMQALEHMAGPNPALLARDGILTQLNEEARALFPGLKEGAPLPAYFGLAFD